jgi:hypothetical protein
MNAQDEPGFTNHIFKYRYKGEEWHLHIPATSAEDAEERLAACATWGQCIGSNGESVPANGANGLIVRLKVLLRNWLGSSG